MDFKRVVFSGILCVAGLVLVASNGCKEKEPAAIGGPAAAAAVQFANAKCPIMGSTITPHKVTADLTREFKGEKVAFCCAGCPDKWDALSDEEKAAKLAAAK